MAHAVGGLRAITGSIGTPPMYSRWIAQPESGGGPHLFVGCHLIDLASWFTGEEPASVQYRPDTGADDTSAIQLEFSNGRIAQFCITQSAAGLFYDLLIGIRARSRCGARNFLQFEIEVPSTVVAAYQNPDRHPTLMQRQPR